MPGNFGDETIWEVFCDVPPTTKRKAIAEHHDVGTSKKTCNKGNVSGKSVEESLGPLTHDTDKNMLFQLLNTMNKTLQVINNDQISSAQRIGLLESEMRCTIEVVENRLRRLEIYNDRQRDFNDRQHDYNDRVSRLLEMLVDTKGVNASSGTQTRVGKDSEGCAGEGSLDLQTKGRISADYPTSPHMSSAAVGHPITPNLDVCQSQHTISLIGEEIDCRLMEKYPDTEGLMYMQDWVPSKSIAHRVLCGKQAGYDPFGPIRINDFARLRSLIERERGLKLGEYTSSSEFYIQLLLHKPRWGGDQYGWLTDTHMSRGMDLFRKRSLEKPSPYKSERIAFLDPLLCLLWCSECAEFERNLNSTLDNYLLEMFNGKIPAYCATNKVWFRDVDILYVAHFFANYHWVAVEINLVERSMIIYDSAPGHMDDIKIANTVRAYETLIEALSRVMGRMEKSTTVKRFVVRRSRVTPLNQKGGDCGIYTLKFIECAALGLPFTGLSDKNIRFIRRKLAVEIMAELTEGSPRQTSQPIPRVGVDKEKLNTASQGLQMEW